MNNLPERLKRNFGFTLIELIVVVAVLSGIVGLFVTNSPASFTKARDTQRRNDLKQYATAIETYASKNNGLYPLNVATVDLATLCPTLAIPKCPEDPEAPTQVYSYQSNATGTNYVIWAHLEGEDQDWASCSNGGVGVLSGTPVNGSCPLLSATSVPTPTAQPTLTPVPTATPTPIGAPTATPTPTGAVPTPTPSNSEPVISPVPIVHWKLDEGSGLYAAGTGSLGTSIEVETASWGTGKYGGALVYSGAEGSRVSDSGDFDMSGRNRTVALWFKADPNQVALWPRFIDHYTGGSSASGWRIGFTRDSNQVTFFHEGSNNVNLITPETLNDGIWHHVAATIPSSGTARLYIDGVEVAADSFSGLIDRNQWLYIGADSNGGTYNFVGSLDDIRIYGEVLSVVDIQTLAGL